MNTSQQVNKSAGRLIVIADNQEAMPVPFLPDDNIFPSGCPDTTRFAWPSQPDAIKPHAILECITKADGTTLDEYDPDCKDLLIDGFAFWYAPEQKIEAVELLARYISTPASAPTVVLFSTDEVVHLAARVMVKERVLRPDQLVIYYFAPDGEIHKLSVDKDGRITWRYPEGYCDATENLLSRLLAY